MESAGCAPAGSEAGGSGAAGGGVAGALPGGAWTVIKAKQRKHHFSEAKAKQLQGEHHVDGLAVALRSPAAETLFEAGWDFDCVVKPNAPAPDSSQDFEYQKLEVENWWKDKVRFRRLRCDFGPEPDYDPEYDCDYDKTLASIMGHHNTEFY